jgi:hypothetical protein
MGDCGLGAIKFGIKVFFFPIINLTYLAIFGGKKNHQIFDIKKLE